MNRRRWRPRIHSRVQYANNSITRDLDIFVADHGQGHGRPALGRLNLAKGPAFTAQGGTSIAARISGPVGPAGSQLNTASWERIGTYSNSIGTGDYTFGAHVRTAVTLSGFDGIAGFGSLTPGFYSKIGASPWGIWHGTAKLGNTNPAANTWYTMIAARRSGTIYFYLNGRADGSAADSSTWGTSGTFSVGIDGSSSLYDGAISWFGFWTRALTAREAAQMHFDPWSVLRRPARTSYVAAAPPAGGSVPAMFYYYRRRRRAA